MGNPFTIDLSETDAWLIPRLRGCALPRTHFYCEECEMTYLKGWSDEESQAEMEANFPGLTKETGACVCDDCYRQIMGLEPAQPKALPESPSESPSEKSVREGTDE